MRSLSFLIYLPIIAYSIDKNKLRLMHHVHSNSSFSHLHIIILLSFVWSSSCIYFPFSNLSFSHLHIIIILSFVWSFSCIYFPFHIAYMVRGSDSPCYLLFIVYMYIIMNNTILIPKTRQRKISF